MSDLSQHATIVNILPTAVSMASLPYLQHFGTLALQIHMFQDYRLSVHRLRFQTNQNHWSWWVCIQSAWIPKTLAHLNCKGRDNRDTTIGYANAIQCVLYMLAWHVCGRLARPTTANWEGLGPSKHTLRNNVGMFIYRFTSPQSGLCKYTNFKTTGYRSIGCDSKPIQIINHGGCASSQHGFIRRWCIWIVRGGTTRTRQLGMQMQYNVVFFILTWHVCGRLARPTTANWKGLGPSKHTLGHNIDMCINMIYLRFVKKETLLLEAPIC